MRRTLSAVGLTAAIFAGGGMLGMPAASAASSGDTATNVNASEENNQGVLNGNNIGVNVPIQACGVVQANVLPILSGATNSAQCKQGGNLSQDNNTAQQDIED